MSKRIVVVATLGAVVYVVYLFDRMNRELERAMALP